MAANSRRRSSSSGSRATSSRNRVSTRPTSVKGRPSQSRTLRSSQRSGYASAPAPVSYTHLLTTTLPVQVPVGGEFAIPWIYLIFADILLMGMSNATNLTDGLDGLLGGTIMVVMVVMAAITFRAGVLDAAIISAAIAGCCIGFLWFNSYPADIFMGDTGSLALGTALGCLAIVSKTEVLSLIIGGLFVVEALSVIIQVLYFKKTRKRLFLMAPLHHHFEKKGWSEVKVVIRFWIISAALAAIGFCLYFAQSLMG